MGHAIDQGCGESFYRVYDADCRVAMTAIPAPEDPETGEVPVTVIWKGEGVESGTSEHDLIIEKVRDGFIAGSLTATSPTVK